MKYLVTWCDYWQLLTVITLNNWPLYRVPFSSYLTFKMSWPWNLC